MQEWTTGWVCPPGEQLQDAFTPES